MNIVNSVGIDVSKGKSMVAILRPMGEVVMLPKEYSHTVAGLRQLSADICSLGENTRVIMEATGNYHEPVADALHNNGIFVTVLNLLYIKQSGGGSIRKVKTDKADAMKIAKYGLDNWMDLREYTPTEEIRQQLKLCSRQYDFYKKTITGLQNNLISLIDRTFPGINELFASPERADGHQKWVDFVLTFWHCDCISQGSEKAFVDRYQKWCKRKDYSFNIEKAKSLYASSCGLFTTLPKNANTKLLITTAAQQLQTAKITLVAMKQEIIRLSQQLPEYETVHSMYGVGEITAAQLMAEIGDLRRFPRRSALVGFAGVDPAVNQSGKYESRSNPTTKRGSPHLRKTLYLIVCTYLKKAPANEPVYQFLDKKRSEGKPFYVYMTAAQNKFLRIYYARVKECLATSNSVDPDQV